ncbi:phospholipase C gamma 1, putative [Babesia bigemina]|uniref:Phosphoinositide phospholipase C n=1 Tax=Babesia bigemina TaxID=5866 RepID=A0A061D1Q8_BABBI|nr:phospholipase C gamma 1, putative [Babesia bigemina]CDR94583.1 phospholipase C gamma 1, putative [Babesia bigemina]|eukprot:XP_012766769.1 phospholipase C gamma 1, putative [Babesia bigemina]
MTQNLNENWMKELAAGSTYASPYISDVLYDEIVAVPVVEAIECVLAGDLLRKWRRGQPLTTKKQGRGAKPQTQEAAENNASYLAVQPSSRSHERYFWVSCVCGTFFLRWDSWRKHPNETVFALCGLDTIRRGDEISSFDNKTKPDAKEKLVFVLSGAFSLRLAAATPRHALLWISGLYHIARHARDVYARAWIANSNKIATWFAAREPDGIPTFQSKTIEQELARKGNSLAELVAANKRSRGQEGKDMPSTVDEVVQKLTDLNIVKRSDVVEPVIAVVKDILATRESWLHKLIHGLIKSDYDDVDNLVRFVADCAYHLEAMDADIESSKKAIFVLDDYMSQDEVIKLMFDVVKHYSIVANVLGPEDYPDQRRPSRVARSLSNNTPQQNHGKSLNGSQAKKDNNAENGDNVCIGEGSGPLAKEKKKSNFLKGWQRFRRARDVDGLLDADSSAAVWASSGAPKRGNWMENEVDPLRPIENDQYQRFLQNVQGANGAETTENLLGIVEKDAKPPFTAAKFVETKYSQGCCMRAAPGQSIPVKMLTIMGFHWSLSQKFNTAAMPQDAEEIAHMLQYPLTSFWIASSHNTYLAGSQVGGAATAGALADALIRGCRCIELDCQDGANGEPMLCHSWKNCQLTGSITLREALLACKETAFSTSKLPVILSMQMTGSEECKAKTAQLCKEILGDNLYVPHPNDPVDHVASVPIGCLLSKFIIKGKMHTDPAVKNAKLDGEWMSVVALHGFRISEVTPDNISHAKRNDMYSMNEGKFAKISADSEFVIKLADISMLRVFPSGTRLSSTNFCPLNAWAAGVHCVAMNYQSCDRSMLINYGKFNQSFGYVLKPPELRPVTFRQDECTDYFCHKPIRLKIHVLSASQLSPPNEGLEQTNFANALGNVLYSIQQGGVEVDMDKVAAEIGKPRKNKRNVRRERREYWSPAEDSLKSDGADSSDTNNLIQRSSSIVASRADPCCPFVEVAVVGENERVQRTDIVSYNGFNPVWADTSPPFEFVVKRPNLSILLLTVKHYDNMGAQLIAQSALPINRIRPGIRWVQLLDQRFIEIDCCGLLLHIDIEYID